MIRHVPHPQRWEVVRRADWGCERTRENADGRAACPIGSVRRGLVNVFRQPTSLPCGLAYTVYANHVASPACRAARRASIVARAIVSPLTIRL